MNPLIYSDKESSTDHLNAENWEVANRKLTSKAISEFIHELILEPEFSDQDEEGWNTCVLFADNPKIQYVFRAKILYLDHWHVEEISVSRMTENQTSSPEFLQFIREFAGALAIPGDLLPVYLEECTATLNSLMFKLSRHQKLAAELATSDFQTIEHAMIEGHPTFVANSGKIGFSITDFHQYAPEADQDFQLVWVAGHKSRTAFHCTDDLNYQTHILDELGADLFSDFKLRLFQKKKQPDDYIFIPVHPWQWENKIATAFANDIASGYLIYLGKGHDKQSAQQSIRTLYNTSYPSKHYTKTALSILNMGFVRGLSPYYMKNTPGITEWITNLLKEDKTLIKCGFQMLGEVATVGYRNLLYKESGNKAPQNKMLSALWRESPDSKLLPGQRVMTMAALLHTDIQGKPLIEELIRQSGLKPENWLASYLHAYLTPVLHCFYQYQLVFMPHGENIILIMENNVPVGIFMKDITEEVIVFDEKYNDHPDAHRLYKETSDEMKITYIFTDVFDGIFRYLSAILTEQCGLEQDLFWTQVKNCVREYQASHPHLQSQFERYDLFAHEFRRCCLNRLQLSNTKQMLDLADPFGSLKWAGQLHNPLSDYPYPAEQEF